MRSTYDKPLVVEISDIDAEVVHHVCRSYIGDMGQAVKAMIKDLS